jgi:hypothetical protein
VSDVGRIGYNGLSHRPYSAYRCPQWCAPARLFLVVQTFLASRAVGITLIHDNTTRHNCYDTTPSTLSFDMHAYDHTSLITIHHITTLQFMHYFSLLRTCVHCARPVFCVSRFAPSYVQSQRFITSSPSYRAGVHAHPRPREKGRSGLDLCTLIHHLVVAFRHHLVTLVGVTFYSLSLFSFLTSKDRLSRGQVGIACVSARCPGTGRFLTSG